MYFKSIELTGFKSFVDHTNITFGDGITAIIGPNGCGKSNISDAIRWVLGEQRAKTLRGAKMEDFIFNGSTSRKPGGMAEVSITMADVEGLVQRPELAEYNEITVTRRLYRSGESEYLINKANCRLKDIVDLFLDTGLSTKAFSIMEQDQVQKIVTSKPENRRFIVEEAAGIMKYKNRRHAALNKLEGSSMNLERVSDIITELERQGNSLKRQASKAERYKRFKNEMGGLFLAVSADEWKTLQSIEVETSGALTQFEEKRAAMEAEISSRQNEMITLQASIDELAARHAELKENDYQLGAIVERNEGKIGLFESQIEEAGVDVEKLGAEALVLQKRMEGVREELADRKEKLEKLNGITGEKSTELDGKKSELAEIENTIETTASEIVATEREQADLSSQLSETVSNIASSKTRLEMLEKRGAGIEREKEEAQADIEKTRAEIEENESAIRGKQEKYDSLLSERNELDSKQNNTAWVKKEKETAIIHTGSSITEKRARLESLQNLDKGMAGYQDGVRSLLRLKDKNEKIAQILHGTLIDKIKSDSRFEKALEVVLGEKLQAVLIRDSKDALGAINLLRSQELGRGTFLPMQSDADDVDLPAIPEAGGVIGRASELIDADEEIRPLLKRLLQDVVFVEDMETALSLNRGSSFTFVTPMGDVVDRFGTISGGSTARQDSGLLERRRAIKELTTALASEEKKIELLTGEMDTQSESLAKMEAELEERNKLVKEEELGLVSERKGMESIQAELDRHLMRMETYKAETEALEMDRENLRTEITAIEGKSKELEARKTELATSMDESRERQKLARENHARMGETLSEMEVELQSLKGDTAMASAERQRLENDLVEFDERLSSIKTDIEANNEKKKNLTEEIANLKEEIHNSLEKRHAISGQIQEISDRLEEMRSQVEAKEGGLKERQAELEEVKELLNDVKIKKSENSVRITALLERAEEQELSREDIEAFDASEMNMEESRERLAEIKEKLSKIGDVNMGAIEEYDQVMERLTFLTTQRDDLLESIEDIKKVIDKLNRKTKKLFEETFNSIKENFKVMFKKLFKGGEAEMFLSDENNMLESGIEIMVRPPGKRRQNINLLSAGEKAMTAVAILFSVFMVKPSPFCLLDEVDAPLDEANIGRFKDMLKEFSKSTQFLVITHNQRTMTFADRLYGITMQQPGISTVLAVDLVDADAEPQERRLKVVGGQSA